MRKWTELEIATLRAYYYTLPMDKLQQRIKRNEGAIRQQAHKIGLTKGKNGAISIHWTPEMIRTLKFYYPYMFNRDLAQLLRISPRSLIRKARELGLQRPPDFLEKNRQAIKQRAGAAIKARGDVRGTWYKKGTRANPDGEFKPGHKETPETRAKRSAALKETHQRKKRLKRLGLSC